MYTFFIHEGRSSGVRASIFVAHVRKFYIAKDIAKHRSILILLRMVERSIVTEEIIVSCGIS